MFNNEDLLHKVESLPEESRKEVENFVDFVLHKQKYQQPLLEEPKSSYELFKGSMKGFFKVSDDFNEPLDDFKEYME